MRTCGIILLIVLFLFSSSSAQAQDWSQMRYDEPEELTILLSEFSDMKAYEAVCNYIEDELNIKTEIRIRPSAVEGENYVKSLLAMGEMTDLCVYYVGALLQSLNPRMYFEDLSGEAFISNIEDSFVNAVCMDGHIYGIPAGTAYAGGWLYNRELHEQLGLAVPTTWNQLMDNCQIIKDNGLIPVIAGYESSWSSQLVLLSDFHNLVYECPGWVEEYNAGNVTFSNTPAALRGFEKLYELSEKGYIPSNAIHMGYEEACQMFAQGSGVYMPILTSRLEGLADHLDNFDIFGQPGDNEGHQAITLWLPQGIYISITSTKKEAAKRWMACFLSSEGQRIFSQYKTPSGPCMVKNIDLEMPDYPYLRTLNQYQQAGNVALALEFVSPLKGVHLPEITQECGAGLLSPKDAAQRFDEDTRHIFLMMNMFHDIS